MGLLTDAVQYAIKQGGPVDAALVRQFRSRSGASVNLEQALTADLGFFARIGKAGGNVETYEFTDIDRSLALGVSLKGNRWERPLDTIGLAALVNGISATRQQYLNAGGLGILVGDGRLPHPGAESILEAYYAFTVRPGVTMTLDAQHVANPAYNRDRGPLSIVAVRLHAGF
jgi:high affinity Mn2+ porin